MTRSPSRHRFVLAGVILIAAIIGSDVAIIPAQRTAAVKAEEQATVDLGRAVAEQTARSFGAVDLVLREIQGEMTAILRAAQGGSGAPLASNDVLDFLLDRQKRVPNTNAIAVIDANGKLLNASRPLPPVAIDVTNRDFFRHFSTEDDHGVYIGAPNVNRLTGDITVFLARRINGPHGAFSGIVTASIRLADLEDFYRSAVPEGRAVTLLRRDGMFLVRYPAMPKAIGTRLPEAAPWYGVLAQGGGIYRSPGYADGVPIMVTVHPLSDLPLVVDVSVLESAVAAGWGSQVVWVLSGDLAASGLVVVLLWLFAAQFRRLELSRSALAAKNDELAIAHRQFDAAISNLSQGLCLFGADRRLIVCNRRYGEIYGLPPEATRPGTTLADIVEHRVAAGSGPNSTSAHYLRSLETIVQAGELDHSSIKLMDGRTVAIQMQPLPDGGFVATHEDVTERCAAEARIVYLARHDVLTGLANRELFRERMEQAVANSGRGQEFAVLFLDLDRFKSVNDTFGHQVGDQLLRGVADRLLACVREVDTVARLGGDEFVILQVGLKMPDHAAILARRVLKVLRAPFFLAGQELIVGTSIGIAVAPDDGHSADTLIRKSDRALYVAKSAGRGTFHFHEADMDTDLAADAGKLRDLRSVMAPGDLQIR